MVLPLSPRSYQRGHYSILAKYVCGKGFFRDVVLSLSLAGEWYYFLDFYNFQDTPSWSKKGVGNILVFSSGAYWISSDLKWVFFYQGNYFSKVKSLSLFVFYFLLFYNEKADAVIQIWCCYACYFCFCG